MERIASEKPRFVANLIDGEVRRGLQVLVWTVFDAESEIIRQELEKLAGKFTVELLTGKTKDKERLAILERFRIGESRVLISLPSMLGYGMNFQHCGSMIFSGWTYSYEQFYQAVRRAYRHGQRRKLRVHIPVIQELEGQMLEAIGRKDRQHEQAIEEMERNYIAAMATIRGTKGAAT